jgi:hypothetical protein
VTSANSVFAVNINETGQITDIVSLAPSIFNASIIESILATDSFFARLFWEPINDDQNADWGTINDNQAPGWSSINNAQTVTWGAINDNQTPGWTEVVDTQNPNWTEITTV